MFQGIDPELALRIVRDESGTIAYDTETTGLEHKDYVVGYVITNKEASIYVPVRHSGGGNIPLVDEFETALADAFKVRSRLGYRTVGHHLGFDLRMSGKTGFGGKSVAIVLGSPLEDTMLNEGLIDDLTQGYGLDDCCLRHHVTPKKGDELYALLAARFGGIPDRKQMKNFSKLEGDNPVAVDYATGDGVSTLELWKSQQKILDDEDLRKVWKLECDLLPYLAQIYLRGVKVDMEYAERLMSDTDPASIKAKIRKAEESFEPGFNVRSPAQVEKLYRANGYGDDAFELTPPSKAHPNGQPSFREAWLENNDIGLAILSVRRLEKARDSFIKPLIETQNYGGRVYPVLHQSKSDEYGVAGARLSCSDPNLMAFPKRNKVVGAVVRPLIIPDFGYISELDFKQQEPCFFTHYAEEPSLIDGYRSNTMDIHDIAESYFHLGRDVSKRLGLGILTGLQAKSLAIKMRWTEEKAQWAINTFFNEAFPRIKNFQKQVKNDFKHRGVVKSILGRKARLESARFAYVGVSRIIQNSGGDHMKTGLLRACQYAESVSGCEILMTIHDSTIPQVDDPKHLRELQRLLEGVAQEPDFNLIVPIRVDIGWGSNWGDASYIKRTGADLDALVIP